MNIRLFSKLLLCGLIFNSYFIQAITIHNKTNRTIFVAPYYLKYNKATRDQDPISMNPKSSESLDRPGRKWRTDREIFFSLKKDELQKTLSGDDINLISHQNIGTLKGADFYIAMIDFKLRGFSFVDWHIIEPLSKTGAKLAKGALSPLRSLIKKDKTAVKDNPYKDKIAQVRTGNNLSPEEQNFLKARKPKVKKALETTLNMKLDTKKVPVIALVGSGGGIRATLMSLGGLTGLAKIGLLDTLTYVIGLSGSTWAIAPWISYDKPIEQARDLIISLLGKGIKNIAPKEVKLIVDALLVKWAFNQPITLVDFYGALLANTLLREFGNNRQRIYLSHQAKTIKSGKYPLPIYTAVRAEKSVYPAWYEFTPYEIGATWLNCYVPTWAFGRSFSKGTSKDFAPEQSLGYFMGIWGSAFAATFNTIYNEMVANIPADIIKNVLEFILKEVGEKRITEAEVFNFSFGKVKSTLKGEKTLKMADAGLAFNLPYPPISGDRTARKADIIIFFDATKEPKEKMGALKGVEEYAQKNKLQLPPIVYDNLKDKAITIFRDEKNPAVPVVIYMPLTKDEELTTNSLSKFPELKALVKLFDFWQCMKNTCDTFNFTYDEKQGKELCALMEFNVRANEKILKEAITQWCDTQ